jgi:2',3'-cyclic-nucleotide 2'-phosphodiesterase (5'-nucleotidase family)
VIVNDTLLIASGSNGKFVSRIDLDVRDGAVGATTPADPDLLRRDHAGCRRWPR